MLFSTKVRNVAEIDPTIHYSNLERSLIQTIEAQFGIRLPFIAYLQVTAVCLKSNDGGL